MQPPTWPAPGDRPEIAASRTDVERLAQHLMPRVHRWPSPAGHGLYVGHQFLRAGRGSIIVISRFIPGCLA